MSVTRSEQWTWHNNQLEVFAHRPDLHRGLRRHRFGGGLRDQQNCHGADPGRHGVAQQQPVVGWWLHGMGVEVSKLQAGRVSWGKACQVL